MEHQLLSDILSHDASLFSMQHDLPKTQFDVSSTVYHSIELFHQPT